MDGVTQYGLGFPAFEIGMDRPTSVRSWLRSTTAIMGTMLWAAR